MSVKDLSAADWDDIVLASKDLILVEFWHHRCKWCLRMEPIYTDVAKEYQDRVLFTRMNILDSHENQEIAQQFGVRGTPTFIFFCEGRPVGMALGMQPRDQFREIVDTMIEKHRLCLDQSTPLP